MVELSPTEIVTEPVRLAFPALFEPKPVTKSKPDEKKYQAAALLPPDYDLNALAEVIKAAMVEKWGKVIKLIPRNNPLKKCEDRDQEKPLAGYEDGWRFLNAKSGYQPSVLNEKKQEVLDPEAVYAGCWVRLHLSAYAWEHAEGGKGVSFSLNAVMKVRDDARLGGRKDAREVFGEVDVSDIGTEFAGDDATQSDGPSDAIDDLLG